MASIIPRATLTASEATELMCNGFLTSANPWHNSVNVFNGLDRVLDGTMTSLSSISKAASGSVAAVGGEGAVHEAGGGGSGGLRRGSSQTQTALHSQHLYQSQTDSGELQLALPSTGPFLRLLTSARSHLMSLLCSSKYREAPLYLLRERWDGGVAGNNSAAKAKKYRGEFVGVVPVRTRKWRLFYGLNLDWVLAECKGAGLIEIFETGSVGRGVRAV